MACQQSGLDLQRYIMMGQLLLDRWTLPLYASCVVRVALGSANRRWWGHYCANPHLLDMTSTATQSSAFTHGRSHKTTHTHKQTHVQSISLHKSALLHGLLAIHKTRAVPRALPAHFSNCLHARLYNKHTLKRWSCGFSVTTKIKEQRFLLSAYF